MNDEYKFQIVDILSDDIPFDVKKDKKIVKEKRFTLTLYGINEKKERMVCHVLKYLPYFYLKIPDDWDRKEIYPMSIGGITIHVKLDDV